MVRILEMVDDLIGLPVPDDPSVLDVVKDLITLRNVAESQIATCAAAMDRLGMAKKAGSTTSKLLQANGAAPSTAARWMRIGTGLSGLDRTGGYFRDGFLSTEHIDAVVKGVGHVIDRSQVSVTSEERTDVERQLLSHAISGAPPSEVEKAARSLGNQVAKDSGALPPAEDPALNSLDYNVNSEGRMVGRFDVDAQIGEKLFSALDYWSKPRPEPDGSEDARSTTQRHADALHQLLDCGGGGQDLVSAPRTEVMVSVPADHPDQASLSWMGPITEATAKALACDSTITSITLDGQQVPIDMSPPQRLFTGQTRKAIIIRDECCIKCGAPASWSDCHHIVYWSDGGTTTLGNGCLLCRTCHRAIHNTNWEITMGTDGHPWLIPPADIDPQRRWLSAYNRRTLTLAA